MTLLMRSLVAAALVLSSQPSHAQEFGRLFFTPEQRAALDARRKARIPDKPAAAAVVESLVTRVDGYVTRGAGRSTVWINGAPVPEGTQPEGMRVVPRRNDPGGVTVGVEDGQTQIDLKIGQSFDRATGEVRDALSGGEVRIGAKPPQKK